MSFAPWDFHEASAADDEASKAQELAEKFVRDAYKDKAVKEEQYRVALARRITELRGEGASITLAADLGRGDPLVARLRMERDVAEGVVEAAKQLSWRCAADRRSVERRTEWSMRRELAEGAAA